MPRINFAEIEEYKPLDDGTYHFAITDVEVGEDGTEKEPEAEWWSLKTTVQDGEQEGKAGPSLWNGFPPHYTPYTLVAVLRATVGQHKWSAEDLEAGDFEVDPDDLEGLEFIGKVRKQKKNKDFKEIYNIQPYDPDEWDTDENILP